MSLGIHDTQVELRQRMTLVCRPAITRRRLRIILGRPLAAGELYTVVELALRVPNRRIGRGNYRAGGLRG